MYKKQLVLEVPKILVDMRSLLTSPCSSTSADHISSIRLSTADTRAQSFKSSNANSYLVSANPVDDMISKMCTTLEGSLKITGESVSIHHHKLLNAIKKYNSYSGKAAILATNNNEEDDNTLDPHLNIISVALGNVLYDDETRYRAVVIFAYNLFRGNLIGAHDSPWILQVIMKKNMFSDSYKLQLEQRFMCRVAYVEHPADQIYMYSIERYLAHDDPSVFRFIAVDSHYLWKPKNIKQFVVSMDNWLKSEKPVIGLVCNNMRSVSEIPGNRLYGGCYFGVQKTKGCNINNIRVYVEEFFKSSPQHKIINRGIDETFLTWFLKKINHGYKSDLFYNVQMSECPVDCRDRLAGLYACPDYAKVNKMYLTATA
jgi:hypothetical protein